MAREPVTHASWARCQPAPHPTTIHERTRRHRYRARSGVREAPDLIPEESGWKYASPTFGTFEPSSVISKPASASASQTKRRCAREGMQRGRVRDALDEHVGGKTKLSHTYIVARVKLRMRRRRGSRAVR